MGVDLSKWGWTEWIGMPADLRRRPFGLVFSLRNFKNICRQVGVSPGRTPGRMFAQDIPTSLQNMLKIIQFNQTKPQLNETPFIQDILCF